MPSSSSQHHCGGFLESAPFFRDLSYHRAVLGEEETNTGIDVLTQFARYFNRRAPEIMKVEYLVWRQMIYFTLLYVSLM